jgi:hypothetical protein
LMQSNSQWLRHAVKRLPQNRTGRRNWQPVVM